MTTEGKPELEGVNISDSELYTMAAKTRHSSGPVLDADVVFPSMENFLHKAKLPSIKSVIGVIRYLTNKKSET